MGQAGTTRGRVGAQDRTVLKERHQRRGSFSGGEVADKQ